MMKKGISILSLLLLSIFYSNAHAEENIWQKFIDDPNEAGYVECSGQIRESFSGEENGMYEKFQSPARLALKEGGVFRDFMRMVDADNVYAKHLAFELYPLLKDDPSAIKTLNVALGRQVKGKPEYFLTILKANQDRHGSLYQGILDSYGDELAGDLEKQGQETQERIEALKKVNKKDLEVLRDRWIKKLKEKKAGRTGS